MSGKQTSGRRWGVFAALALSDARNIARDGLLGFLILLPLGVALIFRFLIPSEAQLERMVESNLPGDLAAYQSLFSVIAAGLDEVLMAIFVGMSPGLIGAVYGLMLVDERDQRTLAVLRVMPINFARYLAARLVTPCGLSLAVTIAAYPLCGRLPLPALDIVAIAVAGTSTVPTAVLAIVTFASNKVGALAMMRVVNGALALPFLAYFASPVQGLLAWPVPSFWQMKALWLASQGQAYVWPLACTLALNMVFSAWLFRRFNRRRE